MSGDDAAVIRAAQAGDRAAFAELVRRYQRPLYSFVLGLVQDAELAADVTQESLVRAWRYLGRFEAERPFRPWLYRIAANRAASRRSRERARPTVPLEELTAEPVAPDDPAGDLQRAELAAQVRWAIGQLSPQQREAMVLVELEGQTANDAAQVMGCSPATVRQHIFRGKKRLRVLLADYVLAADPGGDEEGPDAL